MVVQVEFQSFWDVTPCTLGVFYVSKERCGADFRLQLSTWPNIPADQPSSTPPWEILLE
jgi:hypothetical protein